tara:strand:+ start:5351 stop:5476 length:126 start_codon:yes stop_codon:yes gene_type:complete
MSELAVAVKAMVAKELIATHEEVGEEAVVVAVAQTALLPVL